MEKKRDNLISEFFQTMDKRFVFQKVGCYYELYTQDNDYFFTKEFRSFSAMQNYINEARNKDAEKMETGRI